MTYDREEREVRLDKTVAAFHRAQEAGDEPEASEWIARHPDLAPDLEEHFQMDGLVRLVADTNMPRAPGSGTRFGPYRILRVIGRGGMGMVYEAEDAGTGRIVALKVLPSCILPDPAHAKRFDREASMVASLDHPHILPILDRGKYAGIPYFAMPRIDGLHLRSVVRQLRREREVKAGIVQVPGPSPGIDSPGATSQRARGLNEIDTEAPYPRVHLGGPTAERARAVAAIGVQAADALDHAHIHGVIHRDVKPSNLLLDASGKVFVTDFGVAQGPDRDELTETGDLAGTLRYLPPERLRGWCDPRSDVYSLGLTLYELLTFHPAFDAIDRSRLIRSIAQDTPRRPRSWNREIPRDLETIVRKAIEREPSHRYQSAGAMADDLRRFLEGKPIWSRRVNALRRAWSWSRRNKRKAGAITFVAVSLVGMVASAFWAEHIRRSAAESSAKESHFQAVLLQIEKFRTGAHEEGWSSKVMDRAQGAWKIRPDERLRDQAAASLAGLDIVDRHELKGIGGSSVAFNGDGSLLLIGGREPSETWDGRARIYDVRSKQITQVSKQVGQGPVAFSKSGKALQLIWVEKVGLCLWNVAENRLETPFQEPPAEPPAVLTLSPDGIRAAAAIRVADKPTIRVWDCASGCVLRDLPGDSTALAFSPECERLAAGNDHGEVRVWSPGDGWSSTDQQATGNRIQALSFIRDPRRAARGDQSWLLAAGDAGAEIVILDLMSRTIRTRCVGSPYEVTALAFSSDGTILGSGGRGARLWDASTGTVLLKSSGGDFTSGIDLSGRGDRLAISQQWPDGTFKIIVWRLERGRGIATLRGLTGLISKLAFSPDGQRIAALSHDWRIGVWALDDGRLLGVLAGPRGLYADNAALAFRPDGRQLAVSTGQTAQVWDLDLWQPHLHWKLPPGLSDAVAFRGDSELLLCRFECVDGVHRPYDNDPEQFPRVVRVRNLRGRDPLVPIGDHRGYQRLNASASSPDGRMFILSLIREGPDLSHHDVVAIDSRSDRILWTFDAQSNVSDGLLRMDPAGSLVGTPIRRTHGAAGFALLNLSDGQAREAEDLATAPFLGPGAALVIDMEASPSNEVVLLRLRRRGANASLLRLGIDGEVVLVTTQFERAGRHVAWGRADGLVCLIDLAEIHSRLGSLSELSAVVTKDLGNAAVKSR